MANINGIIRNVCLGYYIELEWDCVGKINGVVIPIYMKILGNVCLLYWIGIGIVLPIYIELLLMYAYYLELGWYCVGKINEVLFPIYIYKYWWYIVIILNSNGIVSVRLLGLYCRCKWKYWWYIFIILSILRWNEIVSVRLTGLYY